MQIFENAKRRGMFVAERPSPTFPGFRTLVTQFNDGNLW